MPKSVRNVITRIKTTKYIQSLSTSVTIYPSLAPSRLLTQFLVDILADEHTTCTVHIPVRTREHNTCTQSTVDIFKRTWTQTALMTREHRT